MAKTSRDAIIGAVKWLDKYNELFETMYLAGDNSTARLRFDRTARVGILELVHQYHQQKCSLNHFIFMVYQALWKHCNPGQEFIDEHSKPDQISAGPSVNYSYLHGRIGFEGDERQGLRDYVAEEVSYCDDHVDPPKELPVLGTKTWSEALNIQDSQPLAAAFGGPGFQLPPPWNSPFQPHQPVPAFPFEKPTYHNRSDKINFLPP